jgi:hypothetical protein
MKRCITICSALTVLFVTSPRSEAQTFTTIYSLAGTSSGFNPNGTPFIGAGGVLYITDAEGGTGTTCTFGCGTVVSLTPPVPPSTMWTASTIYNFQGAPDGEYPGSGVIAGPNGTLVGTSAYGGTMNNPRFCPPGGGCGTVFELTPPAEPGGLWTNQIIVDFPAANVDTFGLVMGPNGVFYGATQYGGAEACDDYGCGSIYEVEPPSTPGGSWTRMPIHHFPGGLDGEFPNSPLVVGANGVLYGTFQQGGAFNYGGIFSLTPPQTTGDPWQYSRLYSFKNAIAGTTPYAGLATGPDGILYGTTYRGGPGCGSAGCFGTVFSMTPPAAPGDTWTKTGLYAFKGGADDGSDPASLGSNLVVGTDGTVYGVAADGGGTACGGQGCGVLFNLTRHSRNQTGKLVTMPVWASNY